MKDILKKVFFRFEEFAGVVIGTIVRPSRFLASGLFRLLVGSAHHLGEKATVLFAPFLMEFGRAALDDRNPIWVSRTLFGGPSIRLDLTEKTQRNIFLYDPYEAGLTRFVASSLQRGDVFVDVGANVGYYTLIAAAHVGEEGRVIACEPEGRNYRLLLANTELNAYANVQALQTAVGDKSETTTLHINPLNRGGNSLLPFDRYKTGATSMTARPWNGSLAATLWNKK